MNLFRDSRTPLDSIRDKLVTLIYFVIVQCPSVERHGTVRVVRGMVTNELRGIKYFTGGRVALHCLQIARL